MFSLLDDIETYHGFH